MSIIQEFKEFAIKGNVVELAVAVVIGTAFGAITNSLVRDVIMPPIGWATGGIDFSDLFIALDGATYASLAEATAAGAPTVNYGVFINTVLNFLIVAWALFLVVRTMNRLKRQKEEVPAAAPEPPPRPHAEVLLEEIRDLLKERAGRP
ncbi:large conductance mechanosensitive channel protein MscL [Caenispirillum bisanense]|uniref:Large-conductance mechanosensitive channel n=1 Tax=Caenispirillum bisanense TaxID=414052 RepID=A0A286GWH9_9PROT|nr:large conductance mechanosensitive channel protein MscL [Caenispirillum bisanense]SOD99842.1 large conductance mechanosensitive channel [Caenispirillum bisanense]